MSLDKQRLIRFLIFSSFSTSATRNQGKGVQLAIKEGIHEHFNIKAFKKCLKQKRTRGFSNFLDDLTSKIAGKPGYEKKIIGRKERKIATGDTIKWGTARKCINLFLRNLVNHGLLWKDLELSESDFTTDGPVSKLELPLDSYAIKGLKEEIQISERMFDKTEIEALARFSIVHLTPERSSVLQKMAKAIAQEKNICPVELDVLFWRREEEQII